LQNNKNMHLKQVITLFLLCFAYFSNSLKFEKGAPPQIQNTPYIQSVSEIPKIESKFFNTGYDGIDVGVGAEGRTYAVSVKGKLLFYDHLRNLWVEVEADREIPAIARVDTDAEGTPYVVTSCGQMYYLNCKNQWVQLPGCGTDIGIGKGNEIWKVGCDQRPGGYGIWKLYCKSKCKCNCERGCMRFRPNSFFYESEEEERNQHTCYWYRIEGGATRLDVDPDGNPAVSTNDGIVYKYDGSNWQRVNGILARDITVCNDGMVIVAGKDGLIYALQNAATSSWVNLSQKALEVSAGPFCHLFAIDLKKNIITNSKKDYN
jgi:hypothetical protein